MDFGKNFDVINMVKLNKIKLRVEIFKFPLESLRTYVYNPDKNDCYFSANVDLESG
jgi:hypothetical protein